MENNHLTSKQRSQTGWRLLGQSELSIDITSQKSSRNWLLYVLVPVSVPEELTHKLTDSLNQTISQLGVPSETFRVEVRIFISEGVQLGHSLNLNWGFFKVERSGNKIQSDHTIEYYIYLEK